MGNVIKGLLLGATALALFLLVWFGLGSWMRSQPSNFMYYGGTIIDVLVLIPVAYMLRSAYNKIF